MVDLRGKPPYLPKNMSYTDVLKYAIEKGGYIFFPFSDISPILLENQI